VPHDVIGSHGGAWIYNVTSNEELDLPLAMSPVYNYATYQVLPLAEMVDPTIMGNASQ
jgi:muconolactone delta-isomerase